MFAKKLPMIRNATDHWRRGSMYTKRTARRERRKKEYGSMKDASSDLSTRRKPSTHSVFSSSELHRKMMRCPR